MRSTRTRTRHRWIAAVASVALVAAACGGDDDDDVTGGAGTDAPAEGDASTTEGRSFDEQAREQQGGGSDTTTAGTSGTSTGTSPATTAGDDAVRGDAGAGREPGDLRAVRHRQPRPADVVVVQHPVPHLRGVPTPARRSTPGPTSATPSRSSSRSWPRSGTVSDDSLTYTFKLREGVVWHERRTSERPAVRRRRRQGDVRGDHGRGPSGEPAVAGHLDRHPRRPHGRAQPVGAVRTAAQQHGQPLHVDPSPGSVPAGLRPCVDRHRYGAVHAGRARDRRRDALRAEPELLGHRRRRRTIAVPRQLRLGGRSTTRSR